MRLGQPANHDPGAGQDRGSELEVDPAPREFAFLLACVRRFFQPETPLPSTAGLDWSRLIQLAERHAVVALFCEAVRGRHDIPAVVLDDLRVRTLEAARFDLTLNAELTSLLEFFECHDIHVVSLKGPVLGAKLYGNAALRSSSDLDLLVRSKDLLQAKQLLEGRGYRMESTLPWPADKACFLRRDSQISFSRQTDHQTAALWVDLHWRLLPGYFPRSFDEREVWRSLLKVPVAGTFASTLSPEHLLLFLCAHGTKHLWERLGWICDIARLLQVEPCLDWTRVFSQARQTGTSRMVVLGLLLASELLGASVPAAAVDYVNADRIARALAETVSQRLDDEILTPASAMESARFARQAFERTGHSVRFIFGIFFQPTEAEYLALKLPPLLHWLYYLFRPVRLAAKYARVRFGSRNEAE